jgi:transposase
MEFLQALLPSTSLLRLKSCTIEPGDYLLLHLSSTQTIVPCPLCGRLTHRIHSRYERTLADLPCVHFRLRVVLQVCKFFCRNPECRRRIFTERLPEVAAPWARKTVRLVERLQSIGLALGGAAGARLGNCLGYGVCGSTLLNQLQKLPLPNFSTPKAGLLTKLSQRRTGTCVFRTQFDRCVHNFAFEMPSLIECP